MQPRRSAPKEGDNVTAAGDPGRVIAILYSRLATSLRSLAIILPIHLHLRSLASTFATVSYNYHTYAYEDERRRMCPYIYTEKHSAERWWEAQVRRDTRG
jgi:hypothetical protein